MQIDEIRKLLDQLTVMMKDNKLTELEIEQDGLRIVLKKAGDRVIAAPTEAVIGAAQQGGYGAEALPAEVGMPTIDSPMVGTLYRSASPDADHYVEIGDTITEETVVAVIEAMKVYNEIRAECEGKVVDILVGNGEAVEYGQPLFVIEPIK